MRANDWVFRKEKRLLLSSKVRSDLSVIRMFGKGRDCPGMPPLMLNMLFF
jgi:hypothetical protein